MLDKLQQEAILGAAVGQLNLLDGLTAKVAPDGEGDIVHVQYGPFDTPFRVVAKAEPGDPFGRVLIAQYVKQRQAETLKNQGVNFIDTLGNAYLRGPNFLLWVTGRTPERLHRTDLPHQAPRRSSYSTAPSSPRACRSYSRCSVARTQWRCPTVL